MGIAPGRQPRVTTQVFVADVMPADKTLQPVDHDDLAMVAEVDLEAIEPATASCERLDLYSAIAQYLAVAGG
ncbi:hypothetical protein D3C76_1314030 [compost metagenome]